MVIISNSSSIMFLYFLIEIPTFTVIIVNIPAQKFGILKLNLRNLNNKNTLFSCHSFDYTTKCKGSHKLHALKDYQVKYDIFIFS